MRQAAAAAGISEKAATHHRRQQIGHQAAAAAGISYHAFYHGCGGPEGATRHQGAAHGAPRCRISGIAFLITGHGAPRCGLLSPRGIAGLRMRRRRTRPG